KSEDELEKRERQIKPGDAATMIYTSGTTGNPKSVMLSHQSLAWTVRQVVQAWHCSSTDRAISYLPLAHVAEQTITIYAPLDSGMQCYLVCSAEHFKRLLSDVQPTVFFGVPRVYEKIYEAIKAGLNEQSQLKRMLFGHFSKVSYDYYCADHAGKTPALLLKTQFHISKKIFSKLKEKIGFGRARLCAVGAAPISKDILNFFMGIDIPIYEVFGQSENCGPTTLNLPGNTKIGSVGRKMPGSEIKVADDGEILIKGPHVFMGYYKDEAATNEALRDGWLYSGDIGSIDADGFISITDRKKDILITAGGKNISPQNLEAMLKHLPYVQSAVVVGDNKKYLCALFSPDMEAMGKKAQLLGLEKDQIAKLVDN
ncbi:MAG TPA: AMP-binding protein, partial [Myxococcota bacterium]|nr:AMP-binding protein [Myxococcota bacterium]